MARQTNSGSLNSFLDVLASETVEVTVGRQDRHGLPLPTYIVHKALLEANSTILQVARPQRTRLRDRFSTARLRKLELPDVDPAIFELFLHFLYRSEYPSFDDHELSRQGDSEDWALNTKVDDSDVLQSARAWVFGVRYQALEFADHAMKHLWEGFIRSYVLTSKLVAWVWQNTNDNNTLKKLRLFIFDAFLYTCTTPAFYALYTIHNPVHLQYWNNVARAFPVFRAALLATAPTRIRCGLRSLEHYLLATQATPRSASTVARNGSLVARNGSLVARNGSLL